MLNSFFYTRKTVHGIMEYDALGGSAVLTLQEAKKYGVNVIEIPSTKIFEAQYKNTKRLYKAQNPSNTQLIGYLGATNKIIGKALLERVGISTPTGFHILKTDDEKYWAEVFYSLKTPLVVKPTHGTQGQSVFMNISELQSFFSAVKTCLVHSSDNNAGVIVEEMFVGKEYRILTTYEKVIGVINRVPANIVGDGFSSIQELIDKKNQDPRRGDSPDDALVKIKVDEHVLKHLSNQNLMLSSVPSKDQKVLLRLNSNISTGGDSIDVTDTVHQSVKEIALAAILAFPGMMFAGIDFMTTDITSQQTPESYRILEINDSPGYSIHDQPYEGKNRHAAYEFLCLLFPELRQDFPEPL